MRFTLATAAAFAVVPAFAQINQTYVQGVVKALDGAGLSALSSAIQAAANTTAGTLLLTELSSNNTNFTVFAPNNQAFAAIPKTTLSNESMVADIINYHVTRGSLNATSFAMSPNHTILNTLLNDTSLVDLGANKSAVLVATAVSNKTVEILNQSKNITVQSSATFQNLIIHVINGVLTPPPKLSEVANTNDLSALISALQAAGLSDTVLNTKGMTIFAPSNDALTKALSSLGAQASNQTFIQAILGNHIINGTEAYSTQLTGANSYTSASGQPFSFNSTNSTIMVTSGNATARITKSDILASNAVVHIIDAVLANGNSDPGAASSAYQSATSQAAASPTQSGPVGSSPAGNSATPLMKGSMGAVYGAVAVAVAAAFTGGSLVL
jgi:uncharacterized surface protein with fasciclin (FAS1) repeats